MVSSPQNDGIAGCQYCLPSSILRSLVLLNFPPLGKFLIIVPSDHCLFPLSLRDAPGYDVPPCILRAIRSNLTGFLPW